MNLLLPLPISYSFYKGQFHFPYKELSLTPPAFPKQPAELLLPGTPLYPHSHLVYDAFCPQIFNSNPHVRASLYLQAEGLS